ncbi:hypothetical protein UAY_01135 [Enterococcus moraviensis ATCC BAA-383]|uniref:Lipoprotein n=1 Tax=Enterococcus moraviensis ATCC BAA-383 TaxID=1158609 RepID=R2TNK3_9ENTE|nr:hypothetical protein [Enterococcus moraviensis]EOI01727.1 hypothetical protein UAY_01135 [Enterococcus moraviensis ATCC BAA-383]EOT73738.1 hypothetical protein I586_00732 [Enterococcus moraviensis ATCC BAA-383]
MKKSILLTVGVSLFLVTGCNAAKKEDTSKSSGSKASTEVTSSTKKETQTTPKSIDIVAKGTYSVGTDINPGSYYFVLTELSHGDKDTDKNAYVTIEVTGKDYLFETFYDVNAKQRFKLEEGQEVRFNDNYSPKSWKVSLLTDSDFQKYMDNSAKDSSESTSSSSKETPPSTSKEETKASENTDSTAFKPTDVSDETIKSIKTYDDYLTMYQSIINNYLAEYESAIKDTVLYDQAAFEEQKKQYEQSFDSQKKQYGDLGNKKLVGKDSLVEFLISYRDGLAQTTASLKESLQ